MLKFIQFEIHMIGPMMNDLLNICSLLVLKRTIAAVAILRPQLQHIGSIYLISVIGDGFGFL